MRELVSFPEPTKSMIFRLGANNPTQQLTQWNERARFKFASTKSGKFKNLPILLYAEELQEGGIFWRALFSNYHGEIYHDYGRESVELVDQDKVGFNNQPRGVVLDAFCKVDFMLDVMICESIEAYSLSENPNKICKFFLDKNGKFHTTSEKIEYLLTQGRLTNVKELDIAKKIRNTFAHQYSPTSDALPRNLVDEYGGGRWDLALTNIFNKCWGDLVKDYIPVQENVIDTLGLK